MFINIDDDAARALMQAVYNGHASLAPLLQTYRDMMASAGASQGFIGQARAQYADDDTEIDDEPAVSRADDGTWVNAWVWVSDGEAEAWTEACDPADVPPVERTYRHSPANCPSNHWNDGNDYCADCGTNLQE